MKKLPVRSFDEYTSLEQIALLEHWWNSYKRKPITPEDTKAFNELIKSNPQGIMDCATISFVRRLTNEELVSAIRNNKIDEFLQTVSKKRKLLESDQNYGGQLFNLVQEHLIVMLVDSHNNPGQQVIMSEEQIQQAASQVGYKRARMMGYLGKNKSN